LHRLLLFLYRSYRLNVHTALSASRSFWLVRWLQAPLQCHLWGITSVGDCKRMQEYIQVEAVVVDHGKTFLGEVTLVFEH
jgi:hypothetical protein